MIGGQPNTAQAFDPDDFEDEGDGDHVASDDEIYSDLDEHNDCTDPGGHAWLADNGIVWCIHCRKRAAE
jgi:hypothetical protein